MEKLRVAIVDDHDLFRKNFKLLLEELPDTKVVGTFKDGKTFLEKIENIEADIIFMDINMPGMSGIQVTDRALTKFPDLNIIAVSMYSDVEYLLRMVNAGVKGYLAKDTDLKDIGKAINTVLSGGYYFPENILNQI